MRKILLALSVLLLVLAGVAGSAPAQAPPPHDHFITVPGTGEVVQVGPHRCELGEKVQRAFLNFHFNVHTGTPATIGGLVVTPVFC
ncbi:MAG: hypothetical protein ACRDJS_02875 [Actinomycetota bacterium]|jgi:hypothetical protein